MSDVRGMVIDLMAIAIKRLIDEDKKIDSYLLYKAADGIAFAPPEITLDLLHEGLASSMKVCEECRAILTDSGSIIGYHGAECSKEPRQKAVKQDDGEKIGSIS
jgi:hypothetical protein